MSAIVIDGKAAARSIRETVKNEVGERSAVDLPVPGLATVLVGEDPASQSYVRAKHRACDETGIKSYAINFSENISQKKLKGAISDLAHESEIHGILVQLPLPKGLDEERILNTIPLEKDVDGFHPINIGRLAQKGRQPLFTPCTPSGIIYLLKKYTNTLGW